MLEVRQQIAALAGGKEDGEFDDQIITTGEIAFSYIGVRYNK